MRASESGSVAADCAIHGSSSMAARVPAFAGCGTGSAASCSSSRSML
ncbi:MULTISPECIES: hypothetical protein [unclassified Caballeronia]|nr:MULTISPECIES: hypothetical protein [unclassified Caballeronia]